MNKILFSLILAFLCLAGYSQENTAANDTIRKDALNVYMAESNYLNTASKNYIKKEIPFINYVRDLKEADLYIILAHQYTGSGGEAFTFFLVGQKRYTGMTDTILVNTMPDDTEDLIRIKQVKTLKMGLMRYVMRTPLAQFFDINFSKPMKETISTDKWKSWVFSANLYGYLNGETSYKETYLDASFTANHITEKNKFEFEYSYGWSNSDYDIDGTTYNSFTRSQYSEILYVKSLGDHWSAGALVSGQSSVYSNYDFKFAASPAIEYDIYPYSQANRRQIRIQYMIGPEYRNYNDTTIYMKTSEFVVHQALSTAYKVVEKWGSLNVSLAWGNFMHDWSKYDLNLHGSTSIRIVKGLSLNLSGSIGLVHDQLSLVKGGATYEEILLRRKEIATQYTYYTSFGLTYTFGSIYNNVVNPRFGY
jgi:hypothetical protein